MYRADVLEEYRDDDALVEPVGFKLLIAMPEVEDATKGGVILPDELRHKETVASIVGCVIAMGPDAYKDQERYPTGPWCKLNDWVVFRAYSGTKIKLGKSQEVRLINDDTVEAVVQDPRKVVRG